MENYDTDDNAYGMNPYHSQAPFHPGFDTFETQSEATPAPEAGHALPQTQYNLDNPLDPTMAGVQPLGFGGTVNPNDLSLVPSTSATHGIGPSLGPSSPTVHTGPLVAASIASKRRTHVRRIVHERDALPPRKSRRNRDVYITCSEVMDHIKYVREILDHDRVTGEVRAWPFKTQKDLFKPFSRLEGRGVHGRIHKCLICGYYIKNATQMVQHVMDHFRHYPFQCNEPDCTFSSTRPADLNKHKREQHEERDISFTCSKCSRTIHHERNFRRHALLHCSAKLSR
ncbi:hypothetical protein CPB86DRAFT_782449 [Serendipita vermifera]|nr:hypothetical protein CPB86DRAFT_782449 [Serendipita vermifera]